ncbi:MAG TPA: PsiF family protein [Gammaproteobacteria bacterium]|nr:PsiF family protein [Gammaproteobacteria bacterium]
MKKLVVPLFIILSVVAFAVASNVSAAEGKTPTPQQEKMANCAHANKGKKGDEYKRGMRECLHGKSTTAAKTADPKASSEEKKAEGMMTPAQEKMKACSAQAKEKQLKGKARTDFMSECLKGG